MTRRNPRKSNQIIAGIAALAVLFFVMLASFYIARETNHDCTGEDCPVCANIRQCEAILDQTWGGAAAVAAAVFPTLLILSLIPRFETILSHETLVSRKIRLNN